jgi:ankyrin repeat protein
MNEDLIKAAANGDIKGIKKMLESGLNVNILFNGQSALHAAAQNGHLDIVKVLLNCGADIEMPDKDGKLMNKITFYLIEFG